MALTDEPRRKNRFGLRALLLVLIGIPVAALSLWSWQLHRKYEGVQVYKTAFEYELEYAHLGVRKSQFYVAQAYDEGFQTGVNKAEAVKWYRKAAAQSHAEAQYQLGLHYLNGEGVPRDDREGFVWIERASFKDHAEAQYRLGQLLCEGRGVEPDCDRGRILMEESRHKVTDLAPAFAPHGRSQPD